jgi:large conductance mechanosensitive channel
LRGETLGLSFSVIPRLLPLRRRFGLAEPTVSATDYPKSPGALRAAGVEPFGSGGQQMSFGNEFKEFIARGNVVDLAVGVIIGGAFGKIVTSLVDQVVMPPIGLITGGVDFSQMKLVLKAADPAVKQTEVAVQYGLFLNTIIQFALIALVIFLIVKAINNLRRQEAEAPAAPPTKTEALLEDIRDAIRSGKTD